MSRIALAVVVLITSSGAAGYSVRGNGTATCAAWTQASSDTRTASEQWVLGFLSGIGFMALGELDPLRGLEAKAVAAWVDDYCRAHPEATLESAAGVFIREHPR